jgi:undecaprenyl-diphosphatase
VAIGLAQSLALIPGVSRSGATISAAMLLGFDRETAARFSFLLAVPAVLASGFFQLYGILSGEEAGDEPFSYVVIATVIAFVTGYAAIAWLLRYVATHSVRLFVVYRIVLGSVVLALVSAGAIS